MLSTEEIKTEIRNGAREVVDMLIAIKMTYIAYRVDMSSIGYEKLELSNYWKNRLKRS